jgi:hypothetical protein
MSARALKFLVLQSVRMYSVNSGFRWALISGSSYSTSYHVDKSDGQRDLKKKPCGQVIKLCTSGISLFVS